MSEVSGVLRCLSDMVCDVVYWCWCGDGAGKVMVVVISSVNSSCSSPRCSWACRHAGSGPRSGALKHHKINIGIIKNLKIW